MNEQKRMGPFATFGVLLNSVSTAAVVLDDTIKTTGSVVSRTLGGIDMTMTKANEALEISLNGPIEDLRCDAVVDDAHRNVRMAQAKAEATRILATLEEPKVVE